ncbi:alpha/beta hydrolase family protein [Pediococcus claussenii]|uniref:Prolyl oligopeptidase family protein n=1 Tax=Pediococcus claussenii (strain ATCC BAA-344 / DSM 14800 / JCM 18046 / KCTC 3811 / LMG 21948 / P06) TaxID=701521 RepID=G8PBC1_PEDCP|nr:alpha/beta hydrolase [Pediococcus claussenii]AEV95910.1 prolyl oligopeptidase family protein [Pediococcus claussenii ATCC BAA-344]ANZ69402.1 alpha/beta hydrolase [Pediococcus claussenii]ANZ71222.1 alpha/beta hydrolase [Pediococcus claussenii]KRN20515.1 hypothetical protein IV79_GL000572 [Pediococcus claussenii]
MKLVFNDQTFSFETLRTMGYAPYGGADIGEVLNTVYGIEEGNFESWFEQWNKLAQRVEDRATEFENNGEVLSASENYVKASNYYRSAEFFLHGDPKDPRLMNSWRKSRDLFVKGMVMSDYQFEEVAIPYENTTMSGYFYKIDDEPRPTMLVHGGYDSTGEELFFQIAFDALKHGYNILTFEGPGQGAMIRKQGLAFRPDWEKVVGPAIDYLESRPEVKKDKIVLMGISFGGLLAARAAAFDHRIAACVLDDGVFSFSFADAFAARGHNSGDFTEIEVKLNELMQHSTSVRWVIENGKFTFGANTIKELFNKTKNYTLKNVANQITCPVLIGEATNDSFFKGQPEMLYSTLECPKTLMKFGPADGAEEHCQLGALNFFNQKVFEWLSKVL